MLNRRQRIQFVVVTALAGTVQVAWPYGGPRGWHARAAKSFRHDLGTGASAADLKMPPGCASPFRPYRTEQAARAYQNAFLRIDNGARRRVSLDNALAKPTIVRRHGVNAPAVVDGHPSTAIALGSCYGYDFRLRKLSRRYRYHTLINHWVQA